MKTWIPFLIGFTLQSCWICPDPVYIQYDNRSKTLEVQSEGFYIKSITITEYVPKDGYIHLIDSNEVVIEQYGARGATTLNIANATEHYNVKGKGLEELLKKKNLHYQVELEKFGNRKRNDLFDIEIVEFVKDESIEKKEYNSKHPCP